MPYPSQLDYDSLIEKAREKIEAEGLQQLSLSKLAQEFGIKAPSLYKYVKNKAELLRAVNLRTATQLIHEMVDNVPEHLSPFEEAIRMAHAYRQFAHQHPQLYSIVFSYQEAESRPDPADLEELAILLQRVVAKLTGEEKSLSALRGLFALVHGYVSLEMNEQFQRGGNLDDTFEQVVKSYLIGWQNQSMTDN